MASISPSLLLLLTILSLASLLNFSAALGGDGGMRGGLLAGKWEKIKDPNAPEIKEIGAFAVSEHNKEVKDGLSFKTVLSGESQVVAGTNYKLLLVAKNGDIACNYETVVYDKPWQHFKQLISFKKA